jgi:uncharacterized CHY-type Zn-finger protein
MEKREIGLLCMRCKHSWTQRGKKKPKVCPCCKSENWNRRKTKDIIDLIIK